MGKLRTLFATYPDKKFLLFGDSGEKDPEIYHQIIQEFPNQVASIYINNVTNDDPKSPRYAGMLLTSNSAQAATDLYQKGFLQPNDVEQVKRATGQMPIVQMAALNNQYQPKT